MTVDLHEDGCIVGSGRSRNYIVVLEPNCPHTVGKGAMLVVSAMDEHLARSWAETHKPPQMHIIDVWPAPESFKMVGVLT